jgi:hypothetical protein
MKIKFRPLGLPFGDHRRADYMFTAGAGVGRQALFMGRGRDSLFERHSCSQARMTACKASNAYRPQALWPTLLRPGIQLESSPLRNCVSKHMCVCSNTGSHSHPSKRTIPTDCI